FNQIGDKSVSGLGDSLAQLQQNLLFYYKNFLLTSFSFLIFYPASFFKLKYFLIFNI
ncbi:hypothetical protein ABPG73_010154, partial [Tetrahymena malaccensis]